MTKLEKLFDIEDAAGRQKAIIEYARSLKIKILSAKKDNGEYSENILAVLIYDAEKGRKELWLKNIFLVVGAIIVLVVMTIVIFALQENDIYKYFKNLRLS